MLKKCALLMLAILISCNEQERIAVTGIVVVPTSITVELGTTEKLSATVYPDCATDKCVRWVSSDESVAVVNDDGTVTGVKPGEAVIWAVSSDNSQTAGCAVEVIYPRDVYIAGQDYSDACCWKNGKKTELPCGSLGGMANSVFISGDDVYIAGYYIHSVTSSVFNRIAAYWKNGKLISLTDGQKMAEANSVFVSDGDVYVAGFIDKTKGNPEAVYWKNGEAVTLSDETLDCIATAICVSVSDVYVAGQQVYDRNANDYHRKALIAVYWKNGKMIKLTDPSRFGFATSICVSGSDFYIAGYDNPFTSEGEPGVAKYWKNGAEIRLGDGKGYSEANSIFVAGPDIYVAGCEVNDKRRYIAKCWKNGEAVALTDGSVNAEATSVYVAGKDVYVVGFEWGGDLTHFARYWKNGKVIPVFDNLEWREPRSIYVKSIF